MNNKGLMFTLEVLISIIILAVAISVVLGGNSAERTDGTFVNFTNQSNRITSLYFNDPAVTEIGSTTICGDFWEYSTGIIVKHTICEGYP